MQCEKKLYYDLFRSDLKPTHTEQQKALFESGNLVGELAQQKYPNGTDASPESHYDFYVNSNYFNKTPVGEVIIDGRKIASTKKNGGFFTSNGVPLHFILVHTQK